MMKPYHDSRQAELNIKSKEIFYQTGLVFANETLIYIIKFGLQIYTTGGCFHR